ncbi:MAG: helix-turn-helix domain-containing protein [Ruminococcaceae bacterium]|nr:helix-turn-helix domain-containing protein [Oscillospiraceae bacterium]
MFYQNELQLLCDTLRKSHVQAFVATEADFTATVEHMRANNLFFADHWEEIRFPRELEPCTMYRLTDGLDLCYIYLSLPDTLHPTVLFIGPYLTAVPSRERLLELGERMGVSPSRQSNFEEYYTGIPLLLEGNHLFILLTTFCERIWQRPSFAIVEVNKRHQASASPINEPLHSDRLDDVLVNMKTMEKRYAFENELIHAVTLGQLHKENLLLPAFSDQPFEKRLADPLRNAKNYGIIMNTLLRKAAENGGVHPVYLDRVSSGFAAKIEQLSDISGCFPLMREMFRAYCRLVRKHTLLHYSPVVQKAVLMIDSDLSANLTLHSLARHQKLSPGYLSTVFKKDVGKTLSEYVRTKRMEHAAYLLATTRLQIQTVALHCGIMDVQYFSKTFKKMTGKTPKEYRESARP